MTNILIDKNALKRIMTDSGVKITVESIIEEYKIPYLIKQLKDLKVSEETINTLRIKK